VFHESTFPFADHAGPFMKSAAVKNTDTSLPFFMPFDASLLDNAGSADAQNPDSQHLSGSVPIPSSISSPLHALCPLSSPSEQVTTHSVVEQTVSPEAASPSHHSGLSAPPPASSVRYVPSNWNASDSQCVLVPSSLPNVVSAETTSDPHPSHYHPPSSDLNLPTSSIRYVPSNSNDFNLVPLSSSNTPRPSTHPMLTRSKSKAHHLLLSYTPDSAPSPLVEPSNIHEAMEQVSWATVVKAELDALTHNNTWSLVPLPRGRIPIRCKWLFKLKKKN